MLVEVKLFELLKLLLNKIALFVGLAPNYYNLFLKLGFSILDYYYCYFYSGILSIYVCFITFAIQLIWFSLSQSLLLFLNITNLFFNLF